MPPKKAEEKTTAADGEGPSVIPGTNPEEFIGNFQKQCKLAGVSSNLNFGCLVGEDGVPATQIIFDASEDGANLSASTCRSFCTGLLGIGPGLSGVPYRNLTSIRVLRCNLGNDGASCFAELLRLGGSELQIQYLELIGCSIGHEGATNLGRSLHFGNNQSLVTLNLDFNSDIGKQGIISLCNGLQTNSTLKQLHLSYCVSSTPTATSAELVEINNQMSSAISLVLSNPLCTLQLLKIPGLSIGCDGLRNICQFGLTRNRSLIKLDISDNNIHNLNIDLCKSCMSDFCDVLTRHVTLTHINLMYNTIGDEAATLLLPAMAPGPSSDGTTKKEIKEMLIDASLGNDVFNGLFRRDASTDKKKKKKKK